ncbi:MAG: flavin reductase family protein [Candidatus Omnitrophota bacterium]|nr:MAG: flavin reductase family protein [Candidatus Omnitrophota bacterium]RKY35056.1 MAG: flavin reductase family protein [Candidatus Omnitrophota bacterium]RKY44415.1 MAG: flavin reductase family protein [Candidatus Omnitrophota bacterium]
MRKELNKNRAYRLVTSGNLVLVTSSYKDRDNIITCSWQIPFSHSPSGLLIALAKRHLSSEFVRKTQEFVINIPDFSLIKEVIFCGTCSGRDYDKFKETNLTKEKAKVLVKTPRIKECIGVIECGLSDIKEAGDHYIFFSEPLYSEVEEGLFDFENFVWKESADLIFHLGGEFFSCLGKVEKVIL